jgi:hypothetical protein
MDWIASAFTIISMHMLLHNKRFACEFLILAQSVWFFYIAASGQYGLIPLTAVVLVQAVNRVCRSTIHGKS